MVDDLNMSQRLRSAAHQVGAAAEQVARGSQFFGVGVSGGEVTTSQEQGQFFAVEFVVFDFATMDRFEVQCVAKHERDIFLCTSVSQPIPVKCRFTAEDEVVAEGFDVGEEFFALSGFEIPVQVFFTILVNKHNFTGSYFFINRSYIFLLRDYESTFKLDYKRS